MSIELDDTIVLSVDNLDQAKAIQAQQVAAQRAIADSQLAIYAQVEADRRRRASQGVII